MDDGDKLLQHLDTFGWEDVGGALHSSLHFGVGEVSAGGSGQAIVSAARTRTVLSFCCFLLLSAWKRHVVPLSAGGRLSLFKVCYPCLCIRLLPQIFF